MHGWVLYNCMLKQLYSYCKASKMARPWWSSSDKKAFPSYQIDSDTQQEQQQLKMRPGGYDCEFVERPKELETQCPICLQVLRDPFQVTCCGNSFCQSCLKRVQANKMSCPICNEANFGAFDDKRLRRLLSGSKVRCTYQKSGCEWTGELGELDRHLNLNPELGKQHRIGCKFVAVACTHCCEYFQRRNVYAHEKESCPQRPFSCGYCEDYSSVYEDVVNSHWPICKCFPVPCPNECGARLERQNVKTHVDAVCPLTVVNCDFHYAGCETQLVRKDIPTHLAESLATHISLLVIQMETLAGRSGLDNLFPHLSLFVLHNQQLTELTMQLKEKLEESQGKIQKLEREKHAQAIANTELQRYFKHEIEVLKREMGELKYRASLEMLQQHRNVFPIELTLTNFAEMKRNSKEWYSPSFYTRQRGYKICLNVFVNGWGDGKGTHVSVYAYLMRGEFDDRLKWPFQGQITIAMLNQLEDNNHTTFTIRFANTTNSKAISRVTCGERAPSGTGYPMAVAHTDLNYKPAKNCQYLKFNCLRFRIISVQLQ